LQASRASDAETLQSQVNKAAKTRLSLSGLEILHGRLIITAAPRQPAAPGSAPEVRPAHGLENGLVRPGRQRVNISFERYYLDLPSTQYS